MADQSTAAHLRPQHIRYFFPETLRRPVNWREFTENSRSDHGPTLTVGCCEWRKRQEAYVSGRYAVVESRVRLSSACFRFVPPEFRCGGACRMGDSMAKAQIATQSTSGQRLRAERDTELDANIARLEYVDHETATSHTIASFLLKTRGLTLRAEVYVYRHACLRFFLTRGSPELYHLVSDTSSRARSYLDERRNWSGG